MDRGWLSDSQSIVLGNALEGGGGGGDRMSKAEEVQGARPGSEIRLHSPQQQQGKLEAFARGGAAGRQSGSLPMLRQGRSRPLES